MSATLRPMNLGEILDRTLDIYRKNFLVFVGLAAMAPFAVEAVHQADILWWHISWRKPQDKLVGFYWPIFVSIFFAYTRLLVSIPTVPALVAAASKAAFGEQASILSSIRVVAARWRSYFWLGILIFFGALIFSEALAAGFFGRWRRPRMPMGYSGLDRMPLSQLFLQFHSVFSSCLFPGLPRVFRWLFQPRYLKSVPGPERCDGAGV
jgi:hypothetical protein